MVLPPRSLPAAHPFIVRRSGLERCQVLGTTVRLVCPAAGRANLKSPDGRTLLPSCYQTSSFRKLKLSTPRGSADQDREGAAPDGGREGGEDGGERAGGGAGDDLGDAAGVALD